MAKLPVSAVINKVTTANPGTGWATLPTLTCHEVKLMNNSGTDVEVRRGGAGETFIVPDSNGFIFEAIANANTLQVRRVDQSNTQVTLKFEAVTR